MTEKLSRPPIPDLDLSPGSQIPALQEVFDYAVGHIVEQGKLSVSWFGCAYRGEGNTRCPVGWFILDELYYARLEGERIQDMPIRRALPSWVRGKIYSLLEQLQNAHDNAPRVNLEGFLISARDICKSSNLAWHWGRAQG